MFLPLLKSLYVLCYIGPFAFVLGQNLNLTKCCAEDDVLGPGLICAKNTTHHYFVLSAETNPPTRSFFDNCSEGAFCVDYSSASRHPLEVACDRKKHFEVAREHMFHKCCPAGYSYNATARGCTWSDRFGVFSFPYVRVALAECRMPIVDYSGGSLEDLQKSYGYQRLDFEKYCVDEIAGTEKLVLRLCHETADVCKMNSHEGDLARCFKKCCPDGYMYYRGYKCVPRFETGLHLDDERIANSTNGERNSRTLRQRAGRKCTAFSTLSRAQ